MKLEIKAASTSRSITRLNKKIIVICPKLYIMIFRLFRHKNKNKLHFFDIKFAFVIVIGTNNTHLWISCIQIYREARLGFLYSESAARWHPSYK